MNSPLLNKYQALHYRNQRSIIGVIASSILTSYEIQMKEYEYSSELKKILRISIWIYYVRLKFTVVS